MRYRGAYRPPAQRGFTDKLYFANLCFAWMFVIVCIVLTVISGMIGITDMAIVNVGIPAVFAELSIHTGFIINKAKVENIRKHGHEVKLDEY